MVILFLILAEMDACRWEGLAIIPLSIIQLTIKTNSTDMVMHSKIIHEIQCVSNILGSYVSTANILWVSWILFQLDGQNNIHIMHGFPCCIGAQAGVNLVVVLHKT